MPTFNNFRDFRKYIEKNIKNALQDDVARSVYNTLQKFVLERVYNLYSPEEYERTYELLRAIRISPVKQDGSNFEVKIYFEPEDMYHTSVYGSQKLGIEAGERVYIAEWVNDGWTWNRPKADFMEYAWRELDSLKPHIVAFIGYMKTKGVVIR